MCKQTIRCCVFAQIFCVHVALSASDSASVQPQATGPFFETHVRPILKTHCFQCHGEEPELAGGLDLRLVRLMQEGGDSGPALLAGDESDSLIVDRIASNEMPPGAKKLTDDEKAIVQDWIKQGASTKRVEPEDPDEATFTDEELSHWAFQPVSTVGFGVESIPKALFESDQTVTPIDLFVARELEASGLNFATTADRRTLIRRLTFDLHGLPPTRSEIASFIEDTSPLAYERLVDRLLASPQYGVRWARHWLDVVGYAESDGNITKDQPRPHAWHYRDYVMDAFNSDKPYDQFLIEQLAGDELIAGPPDRNNPEHVALMAATGMLRMAPDVTQTDDTLLDRNQAVADVLNVVGTSILGMTVGCAQCHDHRYDPITIEDYYRLRAVFDPAFPLQHWKKPANRLVDLTDDATRQQSAEIEAKAVALQDDINSRRRAHCQTIQDREIANVPEDFRDAIRTAVNTKPAEQSEEQKKLLDRFPKVRTIDWIVGQLVEYDNPAHRGFQAEEKQVAEIRATKPLQRMLMAVQESREVVPDSRVFFRGSPESPTDLVQPGELTVLVSTRPHVNILPMASEATSTTGRRYAYAAQLTDGTHPTVARVMANRLWMHHFGRGLVATPGDFGLAGQPPSHPELLDWLAQELVAGSWSIKRLQKQILMSRTYQQSVAARSEIDAENRLLCGMNLRRMEAESVRDAILSVSGQLNVAIGGPSVPVAEDAEGKAVIGKRLLRDGLFAGIEEVGGEANRRSLFIANQRAMPLNLLQTFDLPAMTPNCQRRDASTVAPQSLLFLNDPFIVEASEKMADRLFRDSTSVEARITDAYEVCFAEPPKESEIKSCVEFLQSQANVFRTDTTAAWKSEMEMNPDAVNRRALASLCQVLIASNRFLYIK
jgi:hypothetical protein